MRAVISRDEKFEAQTRTILLITHRDSRPNRPVEQQNHSAKTAGYQRR